MAVRYVKVRHDELDRTVTVPETGVAHLKRQGWRPVEPTKPEPVLQGEPRTIAPATLGRPSENPEDSNEPAGDGEAKRTKRRS